MKVTVAIVTYNREHFMPAIYSVYARQTYPNTELLVLDDSEEPSKFFSQLDDPRVRYMHLPRRLSIGRKRNMLVEQAEGEWICHFDDDDYYAENYVAQMLAHGREVDFVKLTGWFNLSVATRSLTYWDTRSADDLSYRQTGKGLVAARPEQLDQSPLQRKSVLGYGFNYFYRKSIALAFPFEDVYCAEDYPMVDAFVRAGGTINLVNDQRGLVLHQLHASNTSSVSPQYRIPYFLLYQLFPGYAQYEQLLRQEQAPGAWPHATTAAMAPQPRRRARPQLVQPSPAHQQDTAILS